MRAKFEKEHLKQFARSLSIQLKMHSLLWEQGLKVFTVNSSEHKTICSSGKRLQTLYRSQKEMAAQYLTRQEINECFTADTHCCFE